MCLGQHCFCCLSSCIHAHMQLHGRGFDCAAGGLQMMLQKETVAWNKGLMVQPPGVSTPPDVMSSACILTLSAAVPISKLEQHTQYCLPLLPA